MLGTIPMSGMPHLSLCAGNIYLLRYTLQSVLGIAPTVVGEVNCDLTLVIFHELTLVCQHEASEVANEIILTGKTFVNGFWLRG